MFVKQRKSLFLFLQGHPEYDATALFGEYRRDIGRFLAGESDCYPELPHGYFDRETSETMLAFRERALRQRDIALLPDFPAAAGRQLADPWRAAATRLYANWLAYLVERRNLNAGSTAQHGNARRPRKQPGKAAGAPSIVRARAHRSIATGRTSQPRPVSALFPIRQERKAWDDLLTQELIAAQERVADGAVMPVLDLAGFRRELAEFDFSAPLPLDGTLRVGHCTIRARRRSHDASAVFRPVQPGADLPGAMCRPDRRGVQPAAGDIDDLPGCRRDRGPHHPRGRPARRIAIPRPPAISPPAARKPTTPRSSAR